ncbi:MAG: glycosyltransferase family 4 protein [Bacteroidaceae bacterium]|nr:glycosyltransferase family 4 protein [Bacteroidaceae bacterium]
MKIAINCQFWILRGGGGIKEYIANLVNHLEKVDHQNEYVLYVLEDQFDSAKTKLPSRFKLKAIPYRRNPVSRIMRSLFAQRFWSKEEREERFDVFHSPFFHAPKMEKARVLMTVHDLRLYRYPDTYPFLRYQFLKRAVRKSIARVDKIIAISQFTKDEMIDTCGVNPDKVKVIHEAINRSFFNADAIKNYSLPQEYAYLKDCRFLFCLSQIEPRKNHARLIKAFSSIKAMGGFDDLKLVLAGKQLLNPEPVLKLIAETPDVIYLDYVPTEMMLWLYRYASLFVYPSYYEGFGFPPLEAASLGTVSAVGNKSSVPEVCGDCAFYFDPYDVDDMSKVIAAALKDESLIQEKKKKLESQLGKFSWERNAKETVKVYLGNE